MKTMIALLALLAAPSVFAQAQVSLFLNQNATSITQALPGCGGSFYFYTLNGAAYVSFNNVTECTFVSQNGQVISQLFNRSGTVLVSNFTGQYSIELHSRTRAAGHSAWVTLNLSNYIAPVVTNACNLSKMHNQAYDALTKFYTPSRWEAKRDIQKIGREAAPCQGRDFQNLRNKVNGAMGNWDTNPDAAYNTIKNMLNEIARTQSGFRVYR